MGGWGECPKLIRKTLGGRPDNRLVRHRRPRQYVAAEECALPGGARSEAAETVEERPRHQPAGGGAGGGCAAVAPAPHRVGRGRRRRGANKGCARPQLRSRLRVARRRVPQIRATSRRMTYDAQRRKKQ